MNSYELSRQFFDWGFENPEKITPNMTALYFFAIEHCNRLGWKEKFGLPSCMAKDAIGIKSYNTYIQAFDKLVEFGFFKVVEKSKNQYSSTIIALSTALSKNNKALDKALIKHTSKHLQSTGESIDSIDKQVTINNKPIKQVFDLTFLDLEMDNMKIYPDQYEKLVKEFGEDTTHRAIKYLSDYKIEKSYKTKNDYLTIRRWVIEAVSKEKNVAPKKESNPKIGGIPMSEFQRLKSIQL